MQPPPTRHSPCPCGSGKMYKHCHGKPAPLRSIEDDDDSGAVERALNFLHERYRKAYKAAFDEELRGLMPAGASCAPSEEARRSLTINLCERLIAEGAMLVRGGWREINGHLLGPDGPGFTPGQRRWIEQLGCRPLRLYTVTDVRRGEGLTLVDALDIDAAPITVLELALTESAKVGMLFGLRLMQVGKHWELSGALYPFSMLSAGPTTEAAKQLLADPQILPEDKPRALGQLIGRSWLREIVGEAPLPDLRDARTGEPLLFVTDHYELVDEAELTAALACCDDVAVTQDGWSRDLIGADGFTRPLSSIDRGQPAGRIELFHATQSAADEGRAWFEKIAGSAVRHLTREITDPTGVLAKARQVADAASSTSNSGAPAEGINRAELTQAIAGAVERNYARWADEPIPALGGRTPRQAIVTPAGLERVKGLLRSYAEGEAATARKMGRAEISYQFLWDQLGITP